MTSIRENVKKTQTPKVSSNKGTCFQSFCRIDYLDFDHLR